MTGRDRRSSVGRRTLLVLAAVALLFRMAAPPGTMVASTGHGAALVICTGHGAMSGMASPTKAPASKTHSDGTCEFAAHAASVVATNAFELLGSSAWFSAALPPLMPLATVGAGLAAPPPPSHAPPALSI